MKLETPSSLSDDGSSSRLAIAASVSTAQAVVVLVCMIGVLAIVLLSIAGCSQVTDAPLGQDTAAQGSTITVYNMLGPGLELPDQDYWTIVSANASTNGIATLAEDAYAADGAGVRRATGRFVMTGGISNEITSGSTIPTQTGTMTTSPVQDVRSRVSAAIPIAVAPGGIAQPTATAGAGEGPVTSTSDNQADGKWAQLQAAQNQMKAAMDVIAGLMAETPVSTTQPANQ